MRKTNNSKSSKVEYYISVFFSLFFLFLLVRRAIKTCFNIDANYSTFNISELMINYQGGFVRRGLIGELMFQLFQIHPYSFHITIVFIEAFVFVIFAIISYYVFYKLKYAPIMPFAIIVGGLTWYRRDFFMLIIVFFVFSLITTYAKKRQIKHLISAIGVIILSILIYEPSFFFVVPISMLLYYRSLDTTPKCTFKKIQNTFIVFSLPILTMLLACTAKGTTEQAEAIWHSWTPLFEYLNIDQPMMPEAIQFLSRSENINNVVMFHLGLNFGVGQNIRLGTSPSLVIGSLLFFIGTFYLTATTPQRDSLKKSTRQLISIYLFQSICLIPMFTILSCDFGRTILYVIFTSYYLLYFCEKNNLNLSIPHVNCISKKMTCCLSRIPFLSSWPIHLVVLSLLPFNLCAGIPFSRTLFLYEYWPIIQNALNNII